jgi:UDP-N-acetylmuramate dehydrogenase
VFLFGFLCFNISMLEIKENIELSKFTTFRIGGQAKYFVIIKSEEDLREALAFAKTRKLPVFVLGGGSNLLVSDSGFAGLVVKNEIRGIKFVDKDQDRVMLEVGAGEVWDEVVALAVTRNLSGLENLSGIPGTVGGAAVQNAGAYGSELKDCAVTVEGLNLVNGKIFKLERDECEYSYRSSIFKKNKKLVITRVKLELSKKPNLNIEYASLKSRLDDAGEITLQKIRDTVLQIRSEKLPDWHKVGTAGSFFKNPIIFQSKYESLKKDFPDMPSFPESKGQVKVPLAWILDHVCSLKGYKTENVGQYEKQPIVLVNFGNAKAKDVLDFSAYVKKIVKEKIGIDIDEEVEFVK